MAVLTRDEFFALSTIEVEEAKVKIGGEVRTFHVRSISGAERDKWETDKFPMDAKGKVQFKLDNLRARLLESALCNPDGTRFCKDGDAARIGKMNARLVSELYDTAARLAGITKEDLAEIVKNSESDQSAGSTSD